jgi:adenosylcobinamide kinase/adenosylcobinamide-phosphate guanylyltransferase
LTTGERTNQKKLILLLGGARSGKSTLAEQLAQELAPDGRVLYVATAQAGDDEMRERIVAHRSRRPAEWRTL